MCLNIKYIFFSIWTDYYKLVDKCMCGAEHLYPW